jgi:hypothetical protein
MKSLKFLPSEIPKKFVHIKTFQVQFVFSRILYYLTVVAALYRLLIRVLFKAR